jgi:hypothetical protein
MGESVRTTEEIRRRGTHGIARKMMREVRKEGKRELKELKKRKSFEER